MKSCFRVLCEVGRFWGECLRLNQWVERVSDLCTCAVGLASEMLG